MNSLSAFIITIDTEGDNLWGSAGTITTENVRFLPRFQGLCERFGFKPVYLTNYEMAMSDAFVDFGRDVIARDAGEIGMHLHAWNSPPIVPLSEDDHRCHPYLIEYSYSLMRDKVAFMTDLLEDRFGIKMLSHRAGRWAFNECYARLLVEFGYQVDCTVTPGVSWRMNVGAPQGQGGSDYREYPEQAYFIDLGNISRPGNSTLLEVPMTTLRSSLGKWFPWLYTTPLIRGWATRIAPEVGWLRPNGNNLDEILGIVRCGVDNRKSHMEFMLHSSELMPGGSHTFRTASDIDQLYVHMEALFNAAASTLRGMTLTEFHDDFIKSDASNGH